MRLYFKLIVLILMTVGTQCVINGSGGPLDRAQFILHVGLATMCGSPPGDPALVAAAGRLRLREFERGLREVHPS